VELGLAEDSGPSVVVHDDASGPLTLSATVEQADLHDPSTPKLRSHDDHAKPPLQWSALRLSISTST
jgi:hypothetical protein